MLDIFQKVKKQKRKKQNLNKKKTKKPGSLLRKQKKVFHKTIKKIIKKIAAGGLGTLTKKCLYNYIYNST